jgi:hypothetical protein
LEEKLPFLRIILAFLLVAAMAGAPAGTVAEKERSKVRVPCTTEEAVAAHPVGMPGVRFFGDDPEAFRAALAAGTQIGRRAGIDVDFASVDEDFRHPTTKVFDQGYRRALFAYGEAVGRAGPAHRRGIRSA